MFTLVLKLSREVNIFNVILSVNLLGSDFATDCADKLAACPRHYSPNILV